METASVGRVIASHGRHVVVEAHNQLPRAPARSSARRLQVVCGDEVQWRLSDSAGKGIVLDRLPRRSTLSRINAQGQNEVVVANISQLIVLFAAEPKPDFFIVDRYIAAAELHGLKAVVVLNKCELGASAVCDAELSTFAQIGYATARCAATTGAGMTSLRSCLKGEVSVLVGQSGVGKSTLANTLLPGLDAADRSSVTQHDGRSACNQRIDASPSARRRRPDRFTRCARLRALAGGAD